MCTGFINKGVDLIYGFNLDIDPQTWDYDLYKNEEYFSVGIKVNNKVYIIIGRKPIDLQSMG